jgi:hypothetical protein
MSAITWIIIVLIVISILVTVTEVGLRFGMLEKSKRSDGGKGGAVAVGGGSSVVWSTGSGPSDAVVMAALPPEGSNSMARPLDSAAPASSDLEILARTLGLQANATLDDVKRGIWHLQVQQLDDAGVDR